MAHALSESCHTHDALSESCHTQDTHEVSALETLQGVAVRVAVCVVCYKVSVLQYAAHCCSVF